MEDQNKTDSGMPGNENGSSLDFIQEFIEKKRLQNKVLQELINRLLQETDPGKKHPGDKDAGKTPRGPG